MKNYITTLFLICSLFGFTQKVTFTWQSPREQWSTEGSPIKALSFKESSIVSSTHKVGFQKLTVEGSVSAVSFSNVVYENLTSVEDSILKGVVVSSKIDYSLSQVKAREKTLSCVSINPLVKTADGKVRKLKSIEIKVQLQTNASARLAATSGTLSNTSTFLSKGDIYKLSVTQTGVYKVDYSYISSMGVSVSSVDPRTIQFFGFGGMLPEANSENKFFDSPEVPVKFVGNNDGEFTSNEYFLVFMEGPSKLTYNGGLDIVKNLYSDETYYYLTHSNTNGKRMGQKQTPVDFDFEADYYDYLYKHEEENVNLLHSGREWVGESLVTNSSLSFSNTVPELRGSTSVLVSGNVKSSNIISTTCDVTVNGSKQNYTLEARDVSLSFNNIMVRDFSFYKNLDSATVSNGIRLNFKYNKVDASNIVHLDYYKIDAQLKLNFSENYLTFRNLASLSYSSTKYHLRSNKSNVEVWDVTNIDTVSSLPLTSTANGIEFIDATGEYIEYAAVDLNGNFASPRFVSKIANQDLHGLGVPDLLIVTHASFKAAADSLASFRRSHDGYNVEVVTTDKIYEEFSSGSQDISGIRNFVRYLYNKDASKLKYVLLVGACSYDYKNRLTNNTNFVPIYETPNTYQLIQSYSSDDFYGMLDPGEGGSLTIGALDLSVGRLPVRTVSEAMSMVNKIVNYSTIKNSNGRWRNEVTFICDDGDGNTHLEATENIVARLESNTNKIKVNKLYVPLFAEEATPTGQRAPLLKQKLKEQIAKGTLFLNYGGHGRENNIASENVLDINDIRALTNYNKLFLFVAATCEFGRYDDPNISSGLLESVLNPNGAAVATIGSTRPVYANLNENFNTDLVDFMYDKIAGKHYTLGEFFRLAKIQSRNNNENTKNFSLLGDPSMTLNYPKHDVVIDSITGIDKAIKDTIRALSTTNISGSVVDEGSVMTSFNGEVTVTLFDKITNKLTKYDAESDPGAPQEQIPVRESIIFQGKATVKNGRFQTTFIVPKDISYYVGNGYILTYAIDDSSRIDAAGGNSQFLVGDADESVSFEITPPTVKLYINDTTFANGGITGKDVVFIADIYDQSGINLSTTSVGHEITMILDGNASTEVRLNDYYSSDANSFTDGKVTYPLNGLSAGKHTITFKVWDVFNNSTTQTIDFEVKGKDQIVIGILDYIPSPSETFDNFTFSHNRPGENLNMKIDILDMNGTVVRELSGEIPEASTVVSDVRWVTKSSDNMYNISNGMYVYRLTLRSDYDGSVDTKIQKLVFLK
jgi:hypothetical protein